MSLAVEREVFSTDFFIGELSGALGDSITVLPLVVAIGALSDLSLGMMLLGFGVFQVVWGVYYGAPVSVEPMKALAALVIVGGLSTREFALAGLLAGVVLLLIGHSHALGRIESYIGTPVVRGVQFAVALLLLETGIRLGLGNVTMALIAAGIVFVLWIIGVRRATPLAVLAVGSLIAVVHAGPPALTLPTPSSMVSVSTSGLAAIDPVSLLGATTGQLAMTVGNAAVATSLLLSEYYDTEISPDELATSMGVMNLLAAPLGMIPMCHGSGGVAGKFTFGAKTAYANIILGVFYALVALFATGIVMAFPLALLGIVLFLVALELGRTSLESDHRGITLVVGIVSLLSNVGIGFISGLILYHALRWPRAERIELRVRELVTPS